MPTPPTRVLSVLAFCGVAATLLGWGGLSGAWQRRLALLASAAGLVFLLLAVNTEGLRESPTVATFFLGTPYLARPAAASASLPYYVLMAVSLLLGTLGLALREEVTEQLDRHFFLTAVGLSIVVTVLRFTLEKAAAPAALTYPVGIVWLSPLVGAWFAFKVTSKGQGLLDRLDSLFTSRGFRRSIVPTLRGLLSLTGLLFVYALAARGFVALVAIIATVLRFGTHYDVSPFIKVRIPFSGPTAFEPGSLRQIVSIGVVPQFLFWPPFTVLTGLASAAVVLLVALVIRRIRRASSPLREARGSVGELGT